MTTFLQTARFRRDHRWAATRMSAYIDGELLRERWDGCSAT